MGFAWEEGQMNYVRVIEIVALVLVLSGCDWRSQQVQPKRGDPDWKYMKAVNVGHAIEYRAIPYRPTGAPTDHPCLNGSYYHVYETDSGLHGREAWLCCIPLDELFSESFDCDGSFLAPLLGIGDEDYLKVRTCHLQHPTSLEEVFVPVCIPAPERARETATERLGHGT